MAAICRRVQTVVIEFSLRARGVHTIHFIPVLLQQEFRMEVLTPAPTGVRVPLFVNSALSFKHTFN